MKNLLFITSIFLSLNSYAQTFQLSDKSEVSIITCGPGNDELYEAFGHSALRIVDPVQGIDVVYNYGMFDLEGPNFYLNLEGIHLITSYMVINSMNVGLKNKFLI
jgi:hypothetical protein